MATVIRAIYEQGRLRPLDPERLIDGQEVQVAIMSEPEQIRSALAAILAPVTGEPEDTPDKADLLASIDAALLGMPALSEAILVGRREGP